MFGSVVPLPALPIQFTIRDEVQPISHIELKNGQEVSCPTWQPQLFPLLRLLVYSFHTLNEMLRCCNAALFGCQKEKCLDRDRPSWTILPVCWVKLHIESCFLMAPINQRGTGCSQATIVSSERTGYVALTAQCHLPAIDLPHRHVSSPQD